MKKAILFVLLFPLLCHAQSYRVSTLEEKRIDNSTHDTIKRSYWHVLERGTMMDPLNIFYRISSINGAYFLELKLVEGGNKIFVARDEPLHILLDNEQKIVLYNPVNTRSCRGCGARGFYGDDAEGVTLTYPITERQLSKMQYGFVEQIKLYCQDGYWLKRISENHSEIFQNQVAMVLNSQVK